MKREVPEFVSAPMPALPKPEERAANGVWHVTIRDVLGTAEDFYEDQFNNVVDKLLKSQDDVNILLEMSYKQMEKHVDQLDRQQKSATETITFCLIAVVVMAASMLSMAVIS